MECLHARRVLAALDFTAADGTATEENGTTVVTIAGGTTTTVSGIIDSSESPVQGYQLNLGNSDSGLTINGYAEGADFDISVDASLDSSTGDGFVASAVVGDLPVPPTRSLGSFAVAIPDAPGDYRLTANLTDQGELNNTLLSTVTGQSIPITEFGDIIFRVEAPILPTVEISPTTSSQNEDAGTVSLTVTLSETAAADLTVPFTVAGSAVEGSDFGISASPITILAGQQTATIDVAITDDTEEENDETIVVTLQATSEVALGTNAQSTITILENDQVILGTDAALDFVPGAGVVLNENGVTVVEVDPGSTVNVTGQVVSADQPVTRVQLNLANSNPQLTIGNFAVGSEFPVVDDATLDSNASDFFVSNSASGELDVPPARSLGSFDVTVPVVPGDYRLTANSSAGVTAQETLIVNNTAMALDIVDFGDIIFRVNAPVVTIDPASISRDESSGQTTLNVMLSEAVQVDVVVPFSVGGTASLNDDYSIGSTPVTIPAGQTTAEIVVSLVDDQVEESDETVVVTLGTPTNGALGAVIESTVTILDDDAPIIRNATLDFIPGTGATIEENGVTVFVANPGDAVAVIGQIVSADVAVQGYQLNLSNSDSALVLDSFAAGSSFPVTADGNLNSAVQDFFVSSALVGDLVVPPTRDMGSFQVTLPQTPGDYRLTANFTTGTETQNTILTDSASNALTITEFGDLIFRVEAPPVLPTITLSPASTSVGEDAGTLTLTATLSEASGTAIDVPFALTGTATDGTDYTVTMSPVSIPAGQTSAPITITVVDDTVVEQSETIGVTLQSGTGYELGTEISSAVTIVDNDVDPTLPSVDVTPTTATVAENIGGVSFTVVLSAASTADVVVPVTISGTATNGSDYMLDSGPVTIPAGALSTTVTVSVVDDDVEEMTEDVVVTLGNPTNATLGIDTVYTLTITDNDGVPTGTPTRILVPDIIPRPYVIPGDSIPTAIMFGSLGPTSIVLAPIGETSAEEAIVVLDQSLNQISFVEDGITKANLPSEGLYAIVFQPFSEDFVFSLRASDGEQSLISASPTNIFLPTDTNGDGHTTPIDALLVLNAIQIAQAAGELPPELTAFPDVNGDKQLTPVDALQVINKIAEGQADSGFLNQPESEGAEGSRSTDQSLEQLVSSIKIVAEVPGFEQVAEAIDALKSSPAIELNDAALAEVEDFLADSLLSD